MKKYNLSKIMRRAWEIKKQNKENIFSICLQIAWEERKMEEKEVGKDIIFDEEIGMRRDTYDNAILFEDFKKAVENADGVDDVANLMEIFLDNFVERQSTIFSMLSTKAEKYDLYY